MHEARRRVAELLSLRGGRRGPLEVLREDRARALLALDLPGGMRNVGHSATLQNVDKFVG